MALRTLLVVHRTGDQIVIMLPYESETDSRYYAIINEDEAYCASSAVRRMAVAKDTSFIEVGEPGDKLRIERVDHHQYPFEIVFDHEDCVTIIDMKRDEALTFADMLWGAHRGSSFYMAITLTSTPRRREVASKSERWGQSPRQESLSKLLGNTQRRVRGEDPQGKE